MNKKARLIAFYLPQFHPVEVNDKFWGKGFTEWTNVTKAKPLFKGHKQPIHPGELSLYDLRVPEVREQQADLARQYGVDSFCYWHYWFGHGERVLERVFDEVLASKRPDFPFCLGWANESWTGRWHGLDDEFIFEQKYPGEQDFVDHFNTVLPAFKDSRYSKVDGKPIFLVYRPHELPDPADFTALWNRLAKDAGLPGIHFIGVHDRLDLSEWGFDAVVGNAPWTGDFEKARIFKSKLTIASRLKGRPMPEVYDYATYVEVKKAKKYRPNEYPLVVSNWDNTPRSAHRGRILWEGTPQKYREWLDSTIAHVQDKSPEERIVFIKSWNEWAEGNYIEPDTEWERAYLEQTQQAVGI